MTSKTKDRRTFRKPVYSEETNHIVPNSLYKNTSTSESAKDSSRGRIRIFKVNEKPVAYFIGLEGKITKDALTKDEIRLIHLFFARNHVTYTGKIPQADLEEIIK
jgi:hypothetical protein